MYKIIAAEFSISNVTDGEVLSNLLKQADRKINETSADGAYTMPDNVAKPFSLNEQFQPVMENEVWLA
ncbi:hypothetical protein BTN50_0834 [Candidatus Enterovibrio altilux]|uniref:Mobile element protein n=1 Tax=Candidatus Enterovibrio altilux TaxID=1927128 RepID=A0A291B8M8_9GAMM|nr:hypothetical protein BTN50_0834 [Candidatus Enterovibrio luxaltus]